MFLKVAMPITPIGSPSHFLFNEIDKKTQLSLNKAATHYYTSWRAIFPDPELALFERSLTEVMKLV